MTKPQTNAAIIEAPPCPTWCARHDDRFEGWHFSGWHSWRASTVDSDMDAFEFQAVRHDFSDPGSDLITNVGQIDFNVRINDAAGVVLLDDDDTDGSLSCNSMRRFGQFLLALAEQYDPHHTNGKSMEWRQRRNERQP